MRKMNNQDSNNFVLDLYGKKDLSTVESSAPTILLGILEAQFVDYIIIDNIIYTSAQVVKYLERMDFITADTKITYRAKLPLLTMNLFELTVLFRSYGLSVVEWETSLTIMSDDENFSTDDVRLILQKNNVDARNFSYKRYMGLNEILIGE